MTSPDDFSIFFKILVFCVVCGGGGGGGNCTSYGCGFFSFFQNSDFSVFQSSSLNAERKFWGVPHLLHMCVWFFLKAAFRKHWTGTWGCVILSLQKVFMAIHTQITYLVWSKKNIRICNFQRFSRNLQ